MQHRILKYYSRGRFLYTNSKTQHYPMHALSFPVDFQDQIFIHVIESMNVRMSSNTMCCLDLCNCYGTVPLGSL